MTARLEIENLRKSAGDTTLLDGASVYVEAGEIVVVYGRSGCGKTALLDAVSGRIDPDSGDIRIDDQIDRRRAARISRNRHGVSKLRLVSALVGV